MSRKRRYQPKPSQPGFAGARVLPSGLQNVITTPPDMRDRYRPPVTLGCTEEQRLAIDQAMDEAGVYTVLEHTNGVYETFPRFMGYGALQNIAQNGLIRACVSTVADDMTREWIEVTRRGVQEGGEDTLVEDINAAMDAKQLQRVFHEAVELVGYEGGAFIFIDTGARDEELTLPLEINAKSAELVEGGHLRFVVVDPVNCAPGSYNALNPLQADYYKPKYWLVLGRPVHASRMIRLVANEVPVLLKPAYNFLGIPQAQILWDYVEHFQQNRVSVDRLLSKFSMTVFKTKMFESLVGFGAEQASGLDARVKLMVQNMSNDGVLAVDKDNEDVVKLETPLSGLTDIVRQSLELLAAINRTPAVKLLGISPSGFNATGESDLRNYYDHIAAMQRKQLLTGVRIALDCLQLHLRGEIDPSISFTFKPLGEEDKSLQAATRKTVLEGISLMLDRDVVSVEEARKVLAQDPDSGFNDIDPEAVPEPSNMPDAEEQEEIRSIMQQPDADVHANVNANVSSGVGG